MTARRWYRAAGHAARAAASGRLGAGGFRDRKPGRGANAQRRRGALQLQPLVRHHRGREHPQPRHRATAGAGRKPAGRRTERVLCPERAQCRHLSGGLGHRHGHLGCGRDRRRPAAGHRPPDGNGQRLQHDPSGQRPGDSGHPPHGSALEPCCRLGPGDPDRPCECAIERLRSQHDDSRHPPDRGPDAGRQRPSACCAGPHHVHRSGAEFVVHHQPDFVRNEDDSDYGHLIQRHGCDRLPDLHHRQLRRREVRTAPRHDRSTSAATRRTSRTPT